jgi:hypothetical protein
MRLLRALFQIAETPAFLRSLFEQMEKTMRCISNFEQLSLGFYVGRPDKHYVVAISYAGNLAFITTESFNEMLARGHAQSEPFLCWRTRNSMFGSIDGVLGGVLRTFRKGTVMTEVVKDKALYLNRDLTLNI